MQSYSQWLNNKMYAGHVQRLQRIKDSHNKQVEINRKWRIKSQPSKTLQQGKKKQFLPLPLVSKKQRLLLCQVIKGKSLINLKQKQTLLQNYLLSKRILQTNSVFDSKLLKKQYRFHKKVSENMNRNIRINRKTFSQLRSKKFDQLTQSKNYQWLGQGNHFILFKIQEIALIKRKNYHTNTIFNIIFKPQKFKTYHQRAITFQQIVNRKFKFRATKKQLENGLKVEIQQVRGNQSHKFAVFNLNSENLTDKINQQQNLMQQNPQKSQLKLNKSTQFQKEVQTLVHPISKCLIGTIKYDILIKKFKKPEQFI